MSSTSGASLRRAHLEGNDSETLPWGRIVSFLKLRDMLSVRLVSNTVAGSIHDEVLPDDCTRWLGEALRDRSLFMIPGRVDKNWKEATNSESESIIMLLSNQDQAPLDSLLRCLRVCKYIPKEAAVGFSGKYGRHLMPLTVEAQVNFYEPCRRGKKHCPSCRLKIPRKPRRRRYADDDNGSDEEEDGSPRRLDEVLQIAVNAREVLDLDRHYVKCVPNLPRDLTCPLCRVSDQRTLLLTEMTYKTGEETAQGALRNMLTYTPCFEPPDKKTRLEETARNFPPLHQPAFYIPGQESALLPYSEYKHAIAIHCAACQNFGILGPAGLCFGPRQIGDGCGGKLALGDACGSTVGAMLCRRKCRLPSCIHALACGSCRQECDPECCPGCYNHEQALQWHA